MANRPIHSFTWTLNRDKHPSKLIELKSPHGHCLFKFVDPNSCDIWYLFLDDTQDSYLADTGSEPGNNALTVGEAVVWANSILSK